jgi:Malectin domain
MTFTVPIASSIKHRSIYQVPVPGRRLLQRSPSFRRDVSVSCERKSTIIFTLTQHLYYAFYRYVTAQGQRVFNVYVENSLVAASFDAVKRAGPNAAVVLERIVPVTDGVVTKKLVKGIEKPAINGIEIIATSPPVPAATPGTPDANCPDQYSAPITTPVAAPVATPAPTIPNVCKTPKVCSLRHSVLLVL